MSAYKDHMDDMMTTLKDVLYEWQNNPAFREAFKKDPIQALQEAHFELNPDDLTKIQSMLTLKEQESAGSASGTLNKRITK